MRKILMSLAILAIVYNGADAGLFKDDVDLADLSQLSPEALETLKDTEFNVFLMKVKHAGAKVLKEKAGKDLKTSKLTLDAKRSHLNTAVADLKEARATQDQSKIDTAEKALRKAEKDLQIAKMLVEWKEKEADVKSAGVEKAKLAVSVAEAQRDLARVTLLKEQKVASAVKYTLADFKTSLEKKQKAYEKAVSNEKKEILEASKLKAAYEKSSR